jgi:hypothetical protein
MTASLPRHPSIDLLKKQAKMLLSAQRRGAPVRIEACAPLLEKGVEPEASGLEVLEEVVSRIG